MFKSVRNLVSFGAGAALMLALGVAAMPATAASPTLQNWHVHDCTSGCPFYDAKGVWHQRVSFFPKILGETTSQYLADPVACPNATDKTLLPGGLEENQPLRSGVCLNSTTVVHMRSIDAFDPAPSGWTYLSTSVTNGTPYATYYMLTPFGPN